MGSVKVVIAKGLPRFQTGPALAIQYVFRAERVYGV